MGVSVENTPLRAKTPKRGVYVGNIAVREKNRKWSVLLEITQFRANFPKLGVEIPHIGRDFRKLGVWFKNTPFMAKIPNLGV